LIGRGELDQSREDWTLAEVEESRKAYLQVEGELEGNWFALKGKQLLATADTNDGLWAKLRALGVKEPSIGYAPTKEERG
jgi:hypothetical protein